MLLIISKITTYINSQFISYFLIFYFVQSLIVNLFLIAGSYFEGFYFHLPVGIRLLVFLRNHVFGLNEKFVSRPIEKN